MYVSSLFKIKQDTLIAYIDALPHPANIKDMETGKYLFANKHQLKLYGMKQVSELIGMTSHDIYHLTTPPWDNRSADEFTEFGQKTRDQNTPYVINKAIFLDAYGLLHCQDITKLPLLGENNHNIWLTTMIDVQSHLSYHDILDYYLLLYPVKSQACLYMMKHLAVDQIFKEALSVSEIRCLLHMRDDRTYKMIAKKMNICIKTVETHVAHIITKSNCKNTSEILQAITQRRSR